MSELFQTSRTNVVEHIKHIYEEGELEEVSICRNFRQVREEGNRTVSRMMPFYNLDMIISLGYRVKSRVSQTDQGSSLLANASAAGSLVLWRVYYKKSQKRVI